ncbi:MAG: 3-phosphoglycerate dehydrogenase, partial [Clostridiales bacterium]|nr:3-phosphoglycerate dehydrogenase [Clostridiales bacterium]
MYQIQCLNKISPVGLERFDETYTCGTAVEHPDGIMVRSASMHEMELPESLLAIARAGAGVNNIPLEACSERGIVVFNTPGANANAVKELV